MASTYPGLASRWWLLLTIPLALVVTAAGALFMTLSWCGVSGCSGGGFGRISDPSLGGVLAIAATLFAIWIVALLPLSWPNRPVATAALRAGIALIVTALVTLVATAGFVR